LANDGLAIEVKGLTKRYGQVLAVDHISFEVKKGELFGFLGPNGAGKTTTIRMLIGVIRKDDGEAGVMGYPAGSLRAKQLSGVVPEMANAYVDLSGWDNLMLMAELYRTPSTDAKERAEALLRELGLYERKDSKTSTYSMGMRKRLLLAMALINDPQILFLDEPTSGLDVQSARAIREMLRNLRKEGKTIMLTTHNMDEAAELADRVAIINRGRLVSVDTPAGLSITAGRVCLIDVSFDKAVAAEVLAKLPGVSRLETAQAIEAAEKLRAQMAMAGASRPGGMGVGKGQVPAQPAGGQFTTDIGEGEKPEGSRFRLYTEDTTQLVNALVDFSRDNLLTMNILNVRPPSLEDAFVRLTEEKSREK
jgi:ABC-2 type transport system ATP-binding protein